MKKQGCVMEFADTRDVELLHAYYDALPRGAQAAMLDVVNEIIRRPASRYWVSEERVMQVLTQLRYGRDPFRGMRAPKRRMFDSLLALVDDLRRRHPQWPLAQIVAEAVNSPAPEFFMSATYARLRIYRAVRHGLH